MAPVEILLSTYNGAKHLDAQLQSIVSQDFADWSLLIRDDGSSDATIESLQEWRRRYPTRIRLLEDKQPENIGALRSFSRLLELSTAPYVMFADQDDVWLAGKVRLTLDAMRRREVTVGADRPILVHTDLTIVDEDLRVLCHSHWRHQGLAPRADPAFSKVVVENCVWGCTAMLNRPLIDAVGSIPPAAIHHDWWIALVAAAFGATVPIAAQPILYRRHGRNESEISSIAQAARSGLAQWGAARDRLAQILEQSRPRVAIFLERYRERMEPGQIAAAEAFLALPRLSFWRRRLEILRCGLVFTGPLRTLGLLLFV